ncbi:serine carboxypeptidase ctsa-1.1-like [Brevipalpus obovatus]|uniref:serine carboxypeptidase ctsa-1.1-like n=1 Tax=Brevipalpus obovatus TaxID=246614 RepID=UPI003D9DF74D
MCSSCGEDDLISNLPSVEKEFKTKIYSGYLDVGYRSKLFYMLAESENNPEKDPLILWLNGGPGCSSLAGMFIENGPYKVREGGSGLISNQYSWTKFASMLYLESPAYTGFSVGNFRDLLSSDDLTTEKNLIALEKFFQKFPRFRQNDFYITGISYAGVYIPLLSTRLIKETDVKLMGYAIGNGYIDQRIIERTIIDYAHQENILTRSEYEQLKTPCCEKFRDSPLCRYLQRFIFGGICSKIAFSRVLFRAWMKNVNIYNIHDNCARRRRSSSSDRRNSISYTASMESFQASTTDSSQASRNTESVGQGLKLPINCVGRKDLETYLNRDDVRVALRADSSVSKWSACNSFLGAAHRNQYKTLRPEIISSIEAGKRVLLYSGVNDLLCNYIGNEQIFEKISQSMGFNNASRKYAWTYLGHEVGQIQKYPRLASATILGAGHYSGRDRPELCFKLMSSFIQNDFQID